jgi:F0F1-type ATP synthase assembly protein I
MFTGLSLFALVGIALLVMRANTKDLAEKDEQVRHVRQDVRLAAYLLAAILVMLGIIADKIH